MPRTSKKAVVVSIQSPSVAAASHPTAKNHNDEEEEQGDDSSTMNQEDTEMTIVEPHVAASGNGTDIQSPAGMALRSGRKKRRRSRETSGLTPPESQQRKRGKRTTEKNDRTVSHSAVAETGSEKQAGTIVEHRPSSDRSEGSCYTSSEDEESDDNKVNADALSIHATLRITSGIPDTPNRPKTLGDAGSVPLANLRAASSATTQDTRTEPSTATANSQSDFTTDKASEKLTNNNGEQILYEEGILIQNEEAPPPRRIDFLRLFRESLLDIDAVSPHISRYLRNACNWVDKKWGTSFFWVATFFILQMTFYPVVIHPILTYTVSCSHFLRDSYFTWMQSSSTLPSVDRARTIDFDMAAAVESLSDGSRELQLLISEFRKTYTQELLAEQIDSLQDHHSVLFLNLSQQEEQLKSWESNNRVNHPSWQRHLVQLESVFPSWDTPEVPDCPDTPIDISSSVDGAVDWKEVDRIVKKKEEEILLRDSEVFQGFRSKLDTLFENLLIEETDLQVSRSAASGVASTEDLLSVNDLKNRIRDKLELEAADRVGRTDYASILMGASIVKEMTSASIVDHAPILDRMKAQFLPHNDFIAEMAITPSLSASPGECFCFLPESVVSGEEKNNRLGRLTIQLARPVYVDSVVIEKLPNKMEANSSIRDFQLLGYEVRDEEPWDLGTFEFSRENSLQSFIVRDENEDGEEIPKISIITIDVESNWGEAYTCLYRVRVLGTSEND